MDNTHLDCFRIEGSLKWQSNKSQRWITHNDELVILEIVGPKGEDHSLENIIDL